MSILLTTNPMLTDQNAWYVVGGVGIIALYLILRPKKRKEPGFRVPSFPLSRQREVEQQMSNLLVELSDMARQITAQLDTRATKLELLIKEADEKLAELRSATRNSPSPAGGTESEISNSDFEISNSKPEISNSKSEISSSKSEIANLKSPFDPPSPEVPTEGEIMQPPTPQPQDSRHAEVYSLADAGRPTAEIARLLARPAGEIELILAVRPR